MREPARVPNADRIESARLVAQPGENLSAQARFALSLQRAAGNRAVTQLLRSRLRRTIGNRALGPAIESAYRPASGARGERVVGRASSGGPRWPWAAAGRPHRVLQRANLLWTREPPAVIVDIDFGPRSGKQEDHATAVATFGLAVLENLRGQTLKGAVIQLFLLANEITELPGYRDYPTKYLSNQVFALRTDLAALIELAETQQLYVAGQLGALIDTYLRVRNLVPGTKYPREEAIRPPGYKGGGAAEKQGKKKLVEALDKLKAEKPADFARAEDLVADALKLLHDYITTRTKQPTLDELVKIAAQHFHSIMQVSPVLARHATEILRMWVEYMVKTWHPSDPAFAAAVAKACAVHFPEPEIAPSKTRREDVWGSSKDGYYPLGYDEVEVMEVEKYTLHDPKKLSRARTIELLNRAAEQGLVAAARSIEYIIDHPAEAETILANLAVVLVELPDGRIFFRLRGG